MSLLPLFTDEHSGRCLRSFFCNSIFLDVQGDLIDAL